jgi:hypothetical protein
LELLNASCCQVAGLKNKLQLAESKLDDTERDLKKAKEEAQTKGALADDLQRKVTVCSSVSLLILLRSFMPRNYLLFMFLSDLQLDARERVQR